MTINTERDATRWIKKTLMIYEATERAVVQPIESSETSPGILDIWIALAGRPSFWVELKCVEQSAEIVVVPWRPGQLAWAKRLEKVGVEVFLMLFVKRAGVVHVIPSTRLNKAYTWIELDLDRAITTLDAETCEPVDLFSALGGR